MITPAPIAVPDRLRRLPELAMDLWWTWNSDAREVFRQLDYELWRYLDERSPIASRTK